MCACQFLNFELVISRGAVKLSSVCLLSRCVPSIVKAWIVAFEWNPHNVDFPVIEVLLQPKGQRFPGPRKWLIVDTGLSCHLRNKVTLHIKTGCCTPKNSTMYTHTRTKRMNVPTRDLSTQCLETNLLRSK